MSWHGRPARGVYATESVCTIAAWKVDIRHRVCHNWHVAENMPLLKPLVWIGSSRGDLRKFPEDVQDEVGFALYQAQLGEKHRAVKPLKGFGGAGVLEVVSSFEGNAYRAVYTVRLEQAVYVLHAFQKKSRRGIATPAQEIEKIKRRLKMAIDYHKALHEKDTQQTRH